MRKLNKNNNKLILGLRPTLTRALVPTPTKSSLPQLSEVKHIHLRWKVHWLCHSLPLKWSVPLGAQPNSQVIYKLIINLNHVQPTFRSRFLIHFLIILLF